MLHHKFVNIHPFFDGNGRTGRMIINYMLIREDYPPLIVQKKLRDEYLDAMNQGNKAGINETNPKYHKDISQFLADEMIIGYWNNFFVFGVHDLDVQEPHFSCVLFNEFATGANNVSHQRCEHGFCLNGIF